MSSLVFNWLSCSDMASNLEALFCSYPVVSGAMKLHLSAGEWLAPGAITPMDGTFFKKKKSSLFRSVVIRRRLHEQFPQKWKKWGLWGSSRFLGWSGGGTLSSSKKTFMAPFSRRDRLERERRREQHLQGMKKWLTQDVLSSALDQKKTYDTLVIIKWVRGLYSFLQQLFPPMHGKKIRVSVKCW